MHCTLTYTVVYGRHTAVAMYTKGVRIQIGAVSKYRAPKLWALQNIFHSHYLFDFVQIWPYPRQKHVCRPQAPAWQASPWEHSPSSSASCMVPIRLFRIDQHIKDEPCAKQRALLGVFSSRSSSVSRDVRSAAPIWIVTPLVGTAVAQLCTLIAVLSRIDLESPSLHSENRKY